MLEHSSETYLGYKIVLFYDEDAENPEDGCDSAVFLVHFHRSFLRAPTGAPVSSREELAEWSLALLERHEDHVSDSIREKVDSGVWAVFPIASYIHSGVVLSLSGSEFPDQQWDVSRCGAIFVKRDEFGWEGKEAGAPRPDDLDRSIAEAHVQDWNTYLSGGVVRYEVYSPEGELLDACGGYYDSADALGEARGTVRFYAKVPQWAEGQILWAREELVRVLGVTPGSFENDVFTPPSYRVKTINFGEEFVTTVLTEPPAQEGYVLRCSGSLLHERIDKVFDTREEAEARCAPDQFVAKIRVSV